MKRALFLLGNQMTKLQRNLTAVYKPLTISQYPCTRQETTINNRPVTFTCRAYSSMAPSQPEEGATLTANFKVLPTDLASATSPDANDKYAEVLGTPRLVAFMEIVCARMLESYQTAGQMSVGTRVEMDHLAATPVGEQISVTATFLRKEGKQFVFETTITDAGGTVGRGRHKRAMIEGNRLMEGAKKRMSGGSKI